MAAAVTTNNEILSGRAVPRGPEHPGLCTFSRQHRLIDVQASGRAPAGHAHAAFRRL